MKSVKVSALECFVFELRCIRVLDMSPNICDASLFILLFMVIRNIIGWSLSGGVFLLVFSVGSRESASASWCFTPDRRTTSKSNSKKRSRNLENHPDAPDKFSIQRSES